MKDIECAVLVIGAGPGGYVAAIRAGQLGLDTVIVDATPPGGTCLNVGCIPSKALIHAADEFARATHAAGTNQLGIKADKPSIDFGKTIAWKDGIVHRLNTGVAGLLKKAHVKSVIGTARFVDGKTVIASTDMGEQTIRAKSVIIATGSAPVALPDLPFGGQILSSTEALSLGEVPKNLAVVGGGYIGLEIGMAYAKLGAKVSIVEALERILNQFDPDLVRPVLARLEKLGVNLHTGMKAVSPGKDGKSLLIAPMNGGAEQSVAAEKILVTVGRNPVTKGWGLDQLQLEMDGKFLAIDDQCRTSMRGVYAIGDVTGEPMLAHRAMAQGEMVAEILAGHKRAWDKRSIPAICFTDPEIVSVGLSAHQAREKGLEVKAGRFPFIASGRAMTTERDDGFVEIVARADTHEVLGVHAVGAGISELSAAFSLAVEMGATLEDVAMTIHAHPTRSEAFQEAAMKALGLAVHI